MSNALERFETSIFKNPCSKNDKSRKDHLTLRYPYFGHDDEVETVRPLNCHGNGTATRKRDKIADSGEKI